MVDYRGRGEATGVEGSIVTHHGSWNWNRAVNEATARRRPCDECGGAYKERIRRVWHSAGCSRNPVNRRRSPAPETALREYGTKGESLRGLNRAPDDQAGFPPAGDFLLSSEFASSEIGEEWRTEWDG